MNVLEKVIGPTLGGAQAAPGFSQSGTQGLVPPAARNPPITPSDRPPAWVPA